MEKLSYAWKKLHEWKPPTLHTDRENVHDSNSGYC